MASPVISFEVIPNKVVGGNKVLVTGSWNFKGLSNRKRVALYQRYPRHYCIYARSYVDDTGSFEFEYTTPVVDKDISTSIWGILQDTSNNHVAESNVGINITKAPPTTSPERAQITNVCPSTVDGVCSTTGYLTGAVFNIMVTLKNIGGIKGTNGYAVRLYDGSKRLKSFGCRTISPGSSMNAYFVGVTMPDHPYNLTVKVYDRVAGVTSPSFNHQMSFTIPHPSPPPVTCTGGSPHHGTGCKLLLAADRDNDGKVTSVDALGMQRLGATPEEVQFILAASAAGSINAKCPGCYTPPDPCAGVTCSNTCDGTSLYSQKCVNGHCVKGALIKSNAPECGYVPPSPPPVTCTGGSPHHGTGCALLKQFDADNDGKVTSADALRAQNDGRSTEEVQFILAASAAGSINAKCPGCYTPPTPVHKFSVGDWLDTNQPEIKHWFPGKITSLTSTGYIMREGPDGDLAVTFDWEKYIYVFTPYTPPVDSCTGVVCENICISESLYSQKCVDGICVKDILLKSPANAPECKDDELDDEIDDEIYDGTDDETDDEILGQTCIGHDLYQLIGSDLIGNLIEADSPECIEDKGIFGDLDTKWIIIAVIAIIILGLLT